MTTETASEKSPRKSVISWAMYDWANSAFATTVMAGVFPIFYGSYFHNNVSAQKSTFELGIFNSTAGLIVALCAPILGAIADRGGKRKSFLLTFMTMGVIATGGLAFVNENNWLAAAFCFIFGILGFLGGNIFYDSMIIDVAKGRNSDKVSALGYSMGYLGGGLLFTVNVLMILKPELFGMKSAVQGTLASFITVAIWWFVFSMPLAFNIKDTAAGESLPIGKAISAGIRQLKITFSEIRKLRNVFIFLIAYWLYIDGVDTIIVMATKFGSDLGFESQDLIKALLITQFVGFPAAIAFGFLGEKLGTKRALYLALGVYTVVTWFGYRMKSVNEFYILAAVIGLVQGGVQSLSRSYYSRLIPQDKAAEFFGFYNMLGKFATLIGPILMGTVTYATGNSRLGVLSLAILFISGALVLSSVHEDRAKV